MSGTDARAWPHSIPFLCILCRSALRTLTSHGASVAQLTTSSAPTASQGTWKRRRALTANSQFYRKAYTVFAQTVDGPLQHERKVEESELSLGDKVHPENLERFRRRRGVQCPSPNCAHVFANGPLARQVPEATFALYLQAFENPSIPKAPSVSVV